MVSMPSGYIETQVAEIWVKLLGFGNGIVARTDTFDGPSGHSLLFIQMHGKLKETFNVSLEMTDVLSGMALEEIAKIVKTQMNPRERTILLHSTEKETKKETNRSSNMYINNDTIYTDKMIDELKDSDEMTRVEKRMLFINKSNPTSNAYNMPFCFQFNKSINVRRNLSQIIDKITILSTRFSNNKAFSDVSTIIEDSTRYINLWAQFDMESGPLCRFAVDENTNTLMGCIHHSIADGRSVEILLRHLVPGVVEEQYTVRRYSALETYEDVEGVYLSSIMEWKNMLGDIAPRLEIDMESIDDLSSGASNKSISVQEVELDDEMVICMQRFYKEKKLSLFSFAVYVLNHTLRAYSREGFALGVANDTRRSQFIDTIGMFVNTVLIPFQGGYESGRETMKENYTIDGFIRFYHFQQLLMIYWWRRDMGVIYCLHSMLVLSLMVLPVVLGQNPMMII